MNEDKTTEKQWNLIGFIKISPIRNAVLKALDGRLLMPSEISKITGYSASQISNALYALKSKELVICKNESVKKGRIYQNTALASEILEILKKEEFMQEQD